MGDFWRPLTSVCFSVSPWPRQHHNRPQQGCSDRETGGEEALSLQTGRAVDL
jgi:hypothetical protein